MTNDINMPVEVTYNFDRYLMHLIQEVTGRPTIEIVMFFYELAGQVADIGVKAKLKEGGRGIRKKITEYFPGTSIPFTMIVKGHKIQNFRQNAHGGYVESTKFRCQAIIGFPDCSTRMREEELKAISDAIMEQALLDAPMDNVTLPKFDKPILKSPKMYKKLIEAFLNKKDKSEEKK